MKPRHPPPPGPVPRRIDLGIDLGNLVETLRPQVRAQFLRSRVPPQDAEDLLQEVLLAALLRWDTILCLESWILGTLRLRCALYWRRRRNDKVESVDSALLEELSPPLPPRQEADLFGRDLQWLTSGLAARQRQALWLRFGEGLSSEEVARRLGYKPNGVRKLTYRCLEKVQRRAMAEQFNLRT